MEGLIAGFGLVATAFCFTAATINYYFHCKLGFHRQLMRDAAHPATQGATSDDHAS